MWSICYTQAQKVAHLKVQICKTRESAYHTKHGMRCAICVEGEEVAQLTGRMDEATQTSHYVGYGGGAADKKCGSVGPSAECLSQTPVSYFVFSAFDVWPGKQVQPENHKNDQISDDASVCTRTRGPCISNQNGH